MCETETKNSEERIKDTNERVLTLIRDIMSDFTDVVKMLTDTMGAQLDIIMTQEKNNIEASRLSNQAINRQLDIIESQNGMLKNVFDCLDPNDKNTGKYIDIFRKKTM